MIPPTRIDQGFFKIRKMTEEFYERLNSLYLDVSDAIDDFKKEFSNDSVDLSRIDYLSNEISRINVLKRKYNECFFVGSTDKLPPPLSKDDELKYLIEAKKMDISLDKTPSNKIFAKKILQNIGMQMSMLGQKLFLSGLET